MHGKRLPIIMLLLAAVMLFCLWNAPTAEAATDGYYTYTISFGEATITDCDISVSGDITIPATLGGYPVTRIGYRAFIGCADLTSVTMGEGVTAIGEAAFEGCSRLTGIYIPDGVTVIGNSAFSDCTSLTDITIPDSVTRIGMWAFCGCSSLTGITIPEGVTSIDYSAFNGCTSLTSITIPDSVTSVGYAAFNDCRRLTTVYYAGSQTQWNEISIDSNNGALKSANILYNHVHNYTLIPPVTVEATCTEDGGITYTCQHGETVQERIPALGHATGSDTTIVAPTCTEQGYTLSTCPRCGEQGNSQFTDPVGHDFSGNTTVVLPTCLEEGYTIRQCTRCTATNNTDQADALGHAMVFVPATEATCITPGKTQGTKCSRCDYWGLAQTETPKLEHNMVDGFCTRCQPRYPGDMDGNEQINDADAMYLLRYTLFPERYPICQIGDMNADGCVNDADAMYLLRYTLFPDRYPLKSTATLEK